MGGKRDGQKERWRQMDSEWANVQTEATIKQPVGKETPIK